jgi:hypothetical protein
LPSGGLYKQGTRGSRKFGDIMFRIKDHDKYFYYLYPVKLNQVTMKKSLLVLSFVLAMSFLKGQSSDTLLRSAGFFISPAITNIYLPSETRQPDPHFGFSAGYRFENKLKNGFFLEGGVGFNLWGATYPPVEIIYNYGWPSIPVDYLSQKSVTQLNISAPFLAGYMANMGKVRLLGELGFAFNLQNFEFPKYEYTNKPSYVYDYDDNAVEPSFGPGLSLMARAGIRLPLTDRMSIDLLPTARYRFAYFTTKSLDMRKSIFSDIRPWSVGLDVGLVFALKDKESEEVYEYDYNPDTIGDYTIKFKDGEGNMPVKKKLLNNGAKNFVYLEFAGGGLFFSDNYERTVYRQGILSIQARGGFGCFAKKFSVPLGANITLGASRKKFEAGLLVTGENILFDYFNINVVPSLAFRIESHRHFFLRLALITHIVTGSDTETSAGKLIPGFGVSLGGCF